MSFEEYEDPLEYTITEDKIFCDFGDLDYDINEEVATVNAISVYRTGEGIGRKLVELFEDLAIKENAECVLVPASPTKEAVSFWKAMNYKPSGKDDKYWARKIVNGWQESAWETWSGIVLMEKNFKKNKCRLQTNK